MDDAAPVEQLGLSPKVASACRQRGLATLGDLKRITLAEVTGLFGKVGSIEVGSVLRRAGHVYPDHPTPLTLWRHGHLHLNELPMPALADPVTALQPWLPGTTAFFSAGIKTVADLDAAIQAGRARVRGVGDATVRRAAIFLREEYRVP